MPRSTASRLPRRAWLLSALQISLAVGALYDLAFAFVMVLAPEVPARLLALPVPGEPFYLWLIAVLLAMLAGFYMLAAYDPVSYSGNVLVAIVGRTAGAVAFVAAAQGRPELSGLYPLAAADLLFAVLHGIFWWPIKR